jgi:drug/metabolite transporter (DMT)-like permease
LEQFVTTKLDIQQPAVSLDLPVSDATRWKVPLALLAVYTIWGSTYLAMLVGVQSIPPFMMTGIRYLVAGGLLFTFLRLRGVPMLTRQQVRGAVITGILMLGIGTGAVAFAEQQGLGSGLSSVAVAAVPLWVALFAGLYGRWPNRREWYGLGLGMVGIIALNLDKGMQASLTGAIALIVGPVCWAFASIYRSRVNLPPGLMTVAMQMLGGSVFSFLLSMLFRENVTQMPSLNSLLAVGYLVVFGALIGFTAYMYLLENVRPTLATSYAYVNPVVAVMLGAVFMHEAVTPLGIGAMVIILSGVAMVMMARQGKR